MPRQCVLVAGAHLSPFRRERSCVDEHGVVQPICMVHPESVSTHLVNKVIAMLAPIDPFVHVRELKDKIVDPGQSSFREIDIAAMDKKMRAVGAPQDWRHSDDFRETSRKQTLEGRNDRDLWLFAYGSLMWDPGFDFVEVRKATTTGYHRSFCVKSELGRGSPAKPGLMAALDKGGECSGLAFRIASASLDEQTRRIWRREMLLHAYRPEFLRISTPQGEVEGLAFVMDRSAKCYMPRLSIEETARCMATARGLFGTNLQYLDDIIEHFAILGISDQRLLALGEATQRMRGMQHNESGFSLGRN